MTNLKEGQPRRQVTDGTTQEGGRTPTTRRGRVFTFWDKYTAGGAPETVAALKRLKGRLLDACDGFGEQNSFVSYLSFLAKVVDTVA